MYSLRTSIFFFLNKSQYLFDRGLRGTPYLSLTFQTGSCERFSSQERFNWSTQIFQSLAQADLVWCSHKHLFLQGFIGRHPQGHTPSFPEESDTFYKCWEHANIIECEISFLRCETYQDFFIKPENKNFVLSHPSNLYTSNFLSPCPLWPCLHTG